MTSGTCQDIQPQNFVTRVQQLRFPNFVSDISSAFGTFFLCAVLVRSVCVPCAFLVRSLCVPCAVLVRSVCVPCAFLVRSLCVPCAVLVRSLCGPCAAFVRQMDQPAPTSDLCLPLLYRYANHTFLQSATALISFEAAGAVGRGRPGCLSTSQGAIASASCLRQGPTTL
jgi:hypothetical protein